MCICLEILPKAINMGFVTFYNFFDSHQTFS
uniref:NADH-plastoquinone oxidoreductase subunit 4L n=1 Tax=Pyrularia edulis TaxID=212710 RepID=A0A6G7SA73_9MAGN|nr:NADH-plastoquinone oxidoreductase subunit 4L [Pyrularia edulis]QIJ98605.1 NADH-plastoquinone oxidoreductase subunit 4L [Pyrularia edulis]